MATFTELPAELQNQYDALERRKKLREAMMNRPMMTGDTQYVGGRYGRAVPTTGLAGAADVSKSIANLIQGRREAAARKKLAEQAQQGRSDSVRNVMEAWKGRPQAQAVYNEGQMGTGPMVPGIKPDRAGAVIQALSDPYLKDTRLGAGLLDMNQMDRSKERGSYFSTVPTRDGKLMLLNNRTGELIDTGKHAAKYDIPTTQALSGASTTGKAEATRKFNMSGIGQVIDRARNLMTGINPETGEIDADKPTESMVGAAYDWLGSVVGHSPSGAKEATALKALGGALTAKMPRMEGPQSDKDTLLYREMAAQIGDKTIPIDQRMFALQEVERIWAKYEDLNQDIYGDGENQGKTRLKFDAQGNLIQ